MNKQSNQGRAASAAGGKKRNRRRRNRYTIHYMLLFVFCMALGAILCTNVLFKVSSIQVKNNSYYSSEELISRSKIQKGDKLFSINIKDTEAMLQDRFSYLQSVNIKRRLPSTIVIEVTEESPIGAAYTEEGFALLSDSGKVLETKLERAAEDLPVFLGMEEERFSAGSYLYAQTSSKERVLNEKFRLIQRFLQAAEAQGLEPLTYVSISDLEEIEALYDGRILIDFGGELDLDKKITFVQTVLEQGIANNHPLSGYSNDNFQGSIDITDRKQLRTRAIAVDSIADPRAFAVFEEEDAFFAADSTEPEESIPVDGTGEDAAAAEAEAEAENET